MVVENFDIVELFEDETVVNYREIYEGDGEALMDAMLSDHLVLYEDVENTFSIILISVPIDSDLEWEDFSISREVSSDGTISSLEKKIMHQRVAYFKADSPDYFTEEVQTEFAHLMTQKFEPAHHEFQFRTNGVEGREFWFFSPVIEGSDVGVHARVRTIVHEDYIYIIRVVGTEESIDSLEADRLFASFELK